MINTYKIQLVIFLFSVLSIFSSPISAIDFFSSDDDKDYIWKSGLNRYIKYGEQDDSKYGKNQHPFYLSQEDVKNALRSLQVADDSFFALDEETKTVFNFLQIKLLSEQLPKGFNNAKPDQDIIFVLEKSESKLLGLKDQRYLAGRAFFKEGKLNIILGEYDFFRSKAFESFYDPSGREAVPYNFNFGKRTRASKVLKGLPLVNHVGIKNKIFKKVRYDWFVIDVKLAAEFYLAEKNKNDKPQGVNDEALKIEAAKMAKQRREMRAEMARMRKQMKENSKNGSSAKSFEERIDTLDQLRDKELISQEEYDTKRQEILNDI